MQTTYRGLLVEQGGIDGIVGGKLVRIYYPHT